MLHHTEKGSGPPLVLLHGFPVDSGMWEAQVNELSAHCRVIAPDFPGFGQSAGGLPFTVPSMADDIHEWLQNIGALPCVLGGLSMGGYVAMNYAGTYSNDLHALILLDTKDAGDTAEGRENRNRMIEIVRAKGSAPIAEMMLGKMLAPDTVEHRPDQVKALRKMMEACNPKTLEHALIALRDRPDMTEEIPKISIPTLIIVGDADTITPVNVAQGMQKKIAGSKLVIVKGAGHMSAMEQPTQVNRAIRQFLNTEAQRHGAQLR